MRWLLGAMCFVVFLAGPSVQEKDQIKSYRVLESPFRMQKINLGDCSSFLRYYWYPHFSLASTPSGTRSRSEPAFFGQEPD